MLKRRLLGRLFLLVVAALLLGVAAAGCAPVSTSDQSLAGGTPVVQTPSPTPKTSPGPTSEPPLYESAPFYTVQEASWNEGKLEISLGMDMERRPENVKPPVLVTETGTHQGTVMAGSFPPIRVVFEGVPPDTKEAVLEFPAVSIRWGLTAVQAAGTGAIIGPGGERLRVTKQETMQDRFRVSYEVDSASYAPSVESAVIRAGAETVDATSTGATYSGEFSLVSGDMDFPTRAAELMEREGAVLEVRFRAMVKVRVPVSLP